MSDERWLVIRWGAAGAAPSVWHDTEDSAQAAATRLAREHTASVYLVARVHSAVKADVSVGAYEPQGILEQRIGGEA